MKILFLGTGAADWKKGLDDYRRFSSALIDNCLMIDAPGESLELMPEDANIGSLIFTHSHNDHYDPETVKRLAALRTEKGLSPLRIFAESSWVDRIDAPGAEKTAATLLVPFETEGYRITPLPANHMTENPAEQPVHYLIERNGTRLLYATDGAWMQLRAVKALGKEPLSALVIDATIGDGHEGDYRVFEHNSLPMIRIMTDTFRHTGLLPEGAPVILTHMARTLHPGRNELEASLEPPFTAAYDGRVIDI